MCGIMGYYCFANKLPGKEKIADMFSLLQICGTDACGFAFLNEEKNLVVHKAAIRSSEMTNAAAWKTLTLPKVMILHTRMKTQGCQTNNKNNHPLFNKNGLALVHNGIIYNDKEIFAKKQRDAEVDSESILHLLSLKIKGDKIKRLFDRIEGSFAVAVINKTEPDRLILIKKDNPVDLYYNSEDDILYFCSEREIMKESLSIKQSAKHGFTLGEGKYHYYEMENYHVLTINSEGVESYKKYFPRRSMDYFGGNYNRNLTDELIIECPWCFGSTHYYDGLLQNQCEVCGVEINEESLFDVI